MAAGIVAGEGKLEVVVEGSRLADRERVVVEVVGSIERE